MLTKLSSALFYFGLFWVTGKLVEWMWPDVSVLIHIVLSIIIGLTVAVVILAFLVALKLRIENVHRKDARIQELTAQGKSITEIIEILNEETKQKAAAKAKIGGAEIEIIKKKPDEKFNVDAFNKSIGKPVEISIEFNTDPEDMPEKSVYLRKLEFIPLSGIIGYYKEAPIYDRIKLASGMILKFDGIFDDTKNFTLDEAGTNTMLVKPGLIYKAE